MKREKGTQNREGQIVVAKWWMVWNKASRECLVVFVLWSERNKNDSAKGLQWICIPTDLGRFTAGERAEEIKSPAVYTQVTQRRKIGCGLFPDLVRTDKKGYRASRQRRTTLRDELLQLFRANEWASEEYYSCLIPPGRSWRSLPSKIRQC